MSSRVSSKIQQLVNTLKKPKRRPLREYFIDDFEELLEGRENSSVMHLQGIRLELNFPFKSVKKNKEITSSITQQPMAVTLVTYVTVVL